MEEGNILLVDFMYLWNRIFFAIGESVDKNYYEHMHGIMEKISKNSFYTSKYIVLDGWHGTDKHKELLPQYKEGRANKEEVYKHINKFVKEASSIYKNLKFVRADNYEADEVIAALAKRFGYVSNKNVYIYSGDKDLLQLLVFPRVHIGMRYTGNFELKPYTEEELQKKMDTVAGAGNLTNIGDLLKFRVFRGDTSDKIPAVIPRFPSKVIIDLISHTWKGVSRFTDDIMGEMISYLPEKYSKQLIDNEEKLWRNWKLMNLQFLPSDKIINEVKRLT